MSAVRDNAEPLAIVFEDDGLTPNNIRPFLVYQGAVKLDPKQPEATIEDLFEANGWGGTWRNGVYDYLHYHATKQKKHSDAHNNTQKHNDSKHGQELEIKAGDVAILPAGTGHQGERRFLRDRRLSARRGDGGDASDAGESRESAENDSEGCTAAG